MVLVLAACGDAGFDEPAGNVEITVQALDPSSDLGLTAVELEFIKLGPPAAGLTVEHTVPLAADDRARFSAQLLRGDWQLVARAVDVDGNEYGRGERSFSVLPRRRNVVDVVIPIDRGTGTVEGTTTVCHLHLPSVVVPAVVDPGGLVSVSVDSQPEIESITLELLDSLGQPVGAPQPLAPSTALPLPPVPTVPSTLPWVGAFIAPDQQDLYWVTLTSFASSYPDGCQTSQVALAAYVDDPATELVVASSSPMGATALVHDSGGATIVVQVDNDVAFAPAVDESVPDFLGLDELFEQYDLPYLEVCGDTGDACAGAECTGATDETQSMPPGYSNAEGTLWKGAHGGGCGTWAVLMCNRVLGIDGDDDGNALEPVDRAEWNTVADEIDPDGNGGTTTSQRAAYYVRRGCHARQFLFHGDPDEYASLAMLRDQGTDIKMAFWRIVRDASGNPIGLADGHVETVTHVDPTGSVTTNSWGHSATITGGTENGFSHNRYPAEKWPAGDTRVVVQIIWCD